MIKDSTSVICGRRAGDSLKEAMTDLGVCLLLPFYNNRKTVGAVVDALYDAGYRIVAVNDGSTDGSAQVVEGRRDKLAGYVSYKQNRGKGYALRCGFKEARSLGFGYALTFDADGQHTVAGADALVGALCGSAAGRQYTPAAANSIFIGSRQMRGKDGGSKFANDFSNFWLMVQTLKRLPDTQSGCRIYPLRAVCSKHYFSNRYEFELEVLARGAWDGMDLVPVPVEVVYEQEERVSHFRPGRDFMRITLLNILLTLLSPVYGWPKILIHRVFSKRV